MVCLGPEGNTVVAWEVVVEAGQGEALSHRSTIKRPRCILGCLVPKVGVEPTLQ